jgi:hypothetical protein
MSLALTAGLWGLLGASSLIAGAAVAFLLKMPRTVAAGIMSLGCGVLISAVAYDLLEDGFREGGIWPIVGGALAGSVTYAVADRVVSQQGGHCRKRSGNEQRNAGEGGGLAIARRPRHQHRHTRRDFSLEFSGRAVQRPWDAICRKVGRIYIRIVERYYGAFGVGISG